MRIRAAASPAEIPVAVKSTASSEISFSPEASSSAAPSAKVIVEISVASAESAPSAASPTSSRLRVNVDMRNRRILSCHFKHSVRVGNRKAHQTEIRRDVDSVNQFFGNVQDSAEIICNFARVVTVASSQLDVKPLLVRVGIFKIPSAEAAPVAPRGIL